jgi:hypothetical protein
MPTDPQLTDLLLRWEELRGQGRDVTPEELCRQCMREAFERHHAWPLLWGWPRF